MVDSILGNIFMAHKLLLNWLTQTMTECVATSPIKVPGWVSKSVGAFVSCLTVVHFEIILCTQPGSLLPWPGVGHERIPSVMLSDLWLSLLHQGLLFAPSGWAPFPAFVRKSMNNWSPRAKPVPVSSRYLRGAGAASPSVNYTWEAHYPGKGTCWHCKWLGPALPAQGVREGSFPQEITLYILLPVPRHTQHLHQLQRSKLPLNMHVLVFRPSLAAGYPSWIPRNSRIRRELQTQSKKCAQCCGSEGQIHISRTHTQVMHTQRWPYQQ